MSAAEVAVPMVELAGVSKQFGNGPAVLSPLDLEIQKGEFVRCLGHPVAANPRC